MSGAVKKFRLPGPLGAIGKKHFELVTQWVPSLLTYGAASAALVTYTTDWRAVLQYLPYYNGKYEPTE